MTLVSDRSRYLSAAHNLAGAKRRLVWVAAAFSFGVLPLSSSAAGMTSQQRAEWFASLRTPSGRSCCELSDCHRTEATLQADGSWFAVVDGKWRRIPPEKVLKSPQSIDGDAYVCNGKPWSGSNQVNGAIVNAPPSAGAIYCFVPPIPGY
jgi:hypothetical protein